MALSMFDDPVLVERFCTLCATEVRVQTAPLALAAGMTRRGTGAVVWRFVRDRWDDLGDRFPSPLVTRMLGASIPYSCKSRSRPVDRDCSPRWSASRGSSAR